MNWPVINDNEMDRLPRGISNRLTTVKEMDQFHSSEPDYKEDMIGADFYRGNPQARQRESLRRTRTISTRLSSHDGYLDG